MTATDVRSASQHQSTAYSWYVLLILTGVYTFNWMDRYVLVILLEPIKLDLHLSDTQLGVLSGFSFALVYSFAGLPIARWADRGTRRSIIAVGLLVWSSMTTLSGLAVNVMQLTAARFGVALGESACTPPASSLLSDYFSQHRRATAFALYGLGVSLGMALGLLAGGWANEIYGWRAAFMIVGIPGLLLAVLVRFSIAEPARGQQEIGSKDIARYSLRETLQILLRRPSFLAYALGLGLCSFSGNAFETWTPVYLMRLYHMSTGAVGTWTGTVEGVGGVLGTLGGGLLADRLGLRDVRWYLWIPTLSVALMAVCMFVFLHTSGRLMFVFYFITVVGAGAYLAPLIAITQHIMPVRLRALATAFMYLLLNLIGPGAGPTVAGFLNDRLAGAYGNEAVRMSLTLTLGGAVLSIMLFLVAARRLPRDLALAHAVT